MPNQSYGASSFFGPTYGGVELNQANNSITVVDAPAKTNLRELNPNQHAQCDVNRANCLFTAYCGAVQTKPCLGRFTLNADASVSVTTKSLAHDSYGPYLHRKSNTLYAVVLSGTYMYPT